MGNRFLKAVLGRIVIYGLILLGAWWWMFWTPGRASVSQVRPFSADDLALERQLHNDVQVLAKEIGERNIPANPRQLEAAAAFVDSSLTAAGYRPQSQPYNVAGTMCRNIQAEIRGFQKPEEVVIIGAHYDSAPGSPGADDNASGVAALLALARYFAASQPARHLAIRGICERGATLLLAARNGQPGLCKEVSRCWRSCRRNAES